MHVASSRFDGETLMQQLFFFRYFAILLFVESSISYLRSRAEIKAAFVSCRLTVLRRSCFAFDDLTRVFCCSRLLLASLSASRMWCVIVRVVNQQYTSEGKQQQNASIVLKSWLGSRVVSVLDSGAVGPGFKSQPRRCRVTVLGKLFTHIAPLFTKQQNW